MKRISKLLYGLCILAMLASCHKPDDNNATGNNTGQSYRSGTWVINEGNFNYGNTSLSFRGSDGKVTDDVFQLANKRPLGDVLQSMTLFKEQYYLVVNNSQRIEIADRDMKSIGTIEGFTNPRYFFPVNEHKAYVSDMAAQGVWVVDPAERKITGRIDYTSQAGGTFPDWTEQMLQYGDKLFVCAVKGKQVLVVDTQTDKVTDKINVGTDPQWMAMDSKSRLWVMCNASLKKQQSELYCIDPDSNTVKKVFTFPSTSIGPSAMQIDVARSTLYFLYDGVYRMSTDADALPTQVLIPGNHRQLYGLGLDPITGDIYVSDAKDYAQKGTVYVYASDGQLKQSFPAGVIPGSFVFVR